MKLKTTLTEKRVEEIEKLQDGIRTLCGEFQSDFASDPPALSQAVEHDCRLAIASLDMLKGLYKARTEKD